MCDVSIPLLGGEPKQPPLRPFEHLTGLNRRIQAVASRRRRVSRSPYWLLRPLILKRCVVAVTVLCMLSIIYYSHYIFNAPLSRWVSTFQVYISFAPLLDTEQHNLEGGGFLEMIVYTGSRGLKLDFSSHKTFLTLVPALDKYLIMYTKLLGLFEMVWCYLVLL